MNNNADTTIRTTKVLNFKLKVLRGFLLSKGDNKFYHTIVEELIDLEFKRLGIELPEEKSSIK
jgi:hypothetical protein